MDLFVRLNENITSSSLQAIGQESAVISITELVSLGLFFNGIIIAHAIIGVKPKKVWFMEPTTHRVYPKYKFQQVRHTTKVKSYKFVNMITTPQTIAETILVNNDTAPADVTAFLDGSVTNSIETSWSKPSPISIGTNIRSNVINVGGETIEFSNTWGKSIRKTKDKRFTSRINYHLEANKSVTARMIVFETTATVQIQYESKLSGTVVAEYDPKFNGHYFHGIPIDTFLEKIGKQNSFIKTETVKIVMFSKMRVIA